MYYLQIADDMLRSRGLFLASYPELEQFLNELNKDIGEVTNQEGYLHSCQVLALAIHTWFMFYNKSRERRW